MIVVLAADVLIGTNSVHLLGLYQSLNVQLYRREAYRSGSSIVSFAATTPAAETVRKRTVRATEKPSGELFAGAVGKGAIRREKAVTAAPVARWKMAPAATDRAGMVAGKSLTRCDSHFFFLSVAILSQNHHERSPKLHCRTFE